MSAIGMLSGFCGTLMTPMAANFNIVPAALLELPDEYGVIKAQIPTALMLLAANMVLMYFFVYRRVTFDRYGCTTSHVHAASPPASA